MSTLKEKDISLFQASGWAHVPLLQALLLEREGDWDGAHQIAQAIETPDGAWLHAFLHRTEGDLPNADYWYHRAKKTRPSMSLKDEWFSLFNIFYASYAST